MEHVGLTNDFLIKTNHPIAQKYPTKAPMEPKHMDLALQAIVDPKFDQDVTSPARHRAGDTSGHVQLGGHHFAGLADLQLVGREARVRRSARGAHRAAELVGQLVEHLEVLAALEAAATGDDRLLHALGFCYKQTLAYKNQ
ncbi:hypothetical protein PR001_g10561 [Phytophthora rubi]|uniref:PDEase domain-containing protein n=1 Tax=Phytophthora rubi TaxID=129364 RepID=A0A6A3MIW7_9STRA|nr:hypothetical protein PR002_g11537 [Phytophthora rubi]KAE9032557.1 hypothetical protein PR001_g10561 [Phytophthora rubi]